VLSLSEHQLRELPPELFALGGSKLRTLDLSSNQLQNLDGIGLKLRELKSLNADGNRLAAGSLLGAQLHQLHNLQTLSLADNQLGKATTGAATSADAAAAGHDPPHHMLQQLRIHVPHHQPKKQQSPASTAAVVPPAAPEPLPLELPPSLKQLNLASNSLQRIPRCLTCRPLAKLEKLDLSANRIEEIPAAMLENVPRLEDLNLDDNAIEAVPQEIGAACPRLKALSLRNNRLRIASGGGGGDDGDGDAPVRPPLPASLFRSTMLIDLNLHGNPMTNTQLNQLQGFDSFLERRQKVKNKTMNNLSLCGLK